MLSRSENIMNYFLGEHLIVPETGTPSKGLSGVKSSKDNKDSNKNKSETSKNMLVISGGEGYIDFRLGKVPFLLFKRTP